MPLDAVDKGQKDQETEEMRKKREAVLAASPAPQIFKLRSRKLKQGRSNYHCAETENMWLNMKVYAGGGENGLHNHTDEDHFHLVLQGTACFYGPRGEEKHLGPWEGVLLPKGCFYRFLATSEENLVLLRVGCKAGEAADGRFNIYGDPIPSDTKENGRVDVIYDEGYWGPKE
jgi:mannose-6-phosphate isomerase-like protein (cupin superfamily)